MIDYKEFFTTDNKSGWKCVEKKLLKNKPEIHSLIINYCKGILLELPFKQKVWHFINKIPNHITCLQCGKDVKYKNIVIGYQEFCSTKCSNMNLSKLDRTKDSLMITYGVDSIHKLDSTSKNRKKTNLERYGVENIFSSQTIKDGIKKHNIEKYGCEVVSKNIDVREKTKLTNLDRYGSDSHLSNKNIREKIKGTLLERYGVENIFASQIIKDGIKKHNIEKYGYECIFNIPEFKSKYLNKTSKIEEETCLSVKGSEKFIYEKREYDFILGDNIFEIDGDYYHPDNLNDLSLTQANTAINDFYKITSIGKSEDLTLYKVKVSEIKKMKEISIDSLKDKSYIPDYSLSYSQKIITKEYLKKFITKNGKEKLLTFVPMLLKFIRTFQTEFPYPDSYEDINVIKEYIKGFDMSRFHNTIDNSFKNQTSTKGCNYLKSKFKSFWDSSYKKSGVSPIDIWNDDAKMLKIIAYRIGINNSGEVYDLSLRNLIRGISAIRGTISFFKPVVAAGIYKHYLGDNISPTVFDPCCGFGGRLMGFKSLYSGGTYIGCEPNVRTYNELIELGDKFTNVYINNCKLEDYPIKEYDLCFTSIPYFDLEDYKNDVEYASFDEWVVKFITPLFSYKRLVVNMSYELAIRLGVENNIDGYLVNGVTHFDKSAIEKREVLVKLNF